MLISALFDLITNFDPYRNLRTADENSDVILFFRLFGMTTYAKKFRLRILKIDLTST